MQRLSEIYWQLVQEEGPIELEVFLEQVSQGKHGRFTPQEIGDFIDEMFQTMLANIQLKASEAPEYEAMRAEIEERTHQQIRQLKEKYAASE